MFINGIEFFGGYIINTSVVVCCYNNEIKKRRIDANNGDG